MVGSQKWMAKGIYMLRLYLIIIQCPKTEKVKNLRRIICLLIQYTNCLPTAAVVEKWTDVKNLLIAVCSKEVTQSAVEKVCNS